MFIRCFLLPEVYRRRRRYYQGRAPLGRSNINATYLVKCRGGDRKRFVLQRLNPWFFPKPEVIMANLRLLQERGKNKSVPNFVQF
ncbi:MAG: hypothetical protein ACQES8_09820 [Thermodesulfobacteriota bacterium]